MEHSETLPTLAEVGIAFAGFTGLVGAFGGARTGVHPRIHRVRFRGMIESALLCALRVLIAFVPAGET